MTFDLDKDDLTPVETPPDAPLKRVAMSIELCSPSGTMSKRSRKAALKRLHKELFPDGFPEPQAAEPAEKETLLRRASELRELAGRGMHIRKYTKEAERLEEMANGK